MPRRAVVERPEARPARLFAQRTRQRVHGLALVVVALREGTEVHRDRRRRVQHLERAHRVAGRQVARRHDAARACRRDRQQGETHRAEAIVDRSEEFAEACVAGEVDWPRPALDDEAEPQRAPLVRDPPCRPVLRGYARESNALREGNGLPPVDVLRARNAVALEKPRVAESRDDARMKRRHQPTERRQIHVIVVVVAQQHDIDRRQVLEPDSRWRMAPGSRPAHRTRALRPDRVGEDVEAVHLHEQRRVIHERHAQLAASDARRRRVERRVHPLRPHSAVAGESARGAAQRVVEHRIAKA